MSLSLCFGRVDVTGHTQWVVLCIKEETGLVDELRDSHGVVVSVVVGGAAVLLMRETPHAVQPGLQVSSTQSFQVRGLLAEVDLVFTQELLL